MYAKVCEIDKSGGFVKLDVMGRVTDWLPCVSATPSVGQQVAFVEFANDGSGYVIGPLARNDGNPISLHVGGIDITIDGASVVVKSDAKITGDVEIVGNLKVDGNIDTTGTITDKEGNLTNFVDSGGDTRP